MKDSISTNELARICGVSQGTVDRALNNRKGISEKTKQRILDIAKEYGYKPNIHARSIAGGKSMLIGVVVFDLANQYFSDMLMNIEKYCAGKSYSTVVMFTDKDPQKEIECIKHLYHISVDGIVLCPANNGEEYENYLLSLNIPIVTVGNRLNRIKYVGINNRAAMEETLNFILDKGYNRFIYVKPTLNNKNAYAQIERFNAFENVMKSVKAEYVITNIADAENQLVNDKKNIFICPTDVYAIRLLNLASKKGVGIIGFDNLKLIDDLRLCLDSVSYDDDKTARLAVDYIIDGKDEDTEVNHKLIKRGSV